MKKTTYAIIAALTFAPALVFAKDGGHKANPAVVYNGPVETASVNELLADNSMFSEQNVIVDGYLVRQIKGDKFIFSDGNAEIQVELDDVVLTTPIDNKTKVRIFGEYEGGSTPEIEVDHIQIM
ncbi:YgiW/YdeI family stress tolerance OB fold protein [Vibrio nomapromontoriensis]|uniref:YgiW/YdeI family stress tolerance OB fold protein n=1 Tax=Vibrio nomapromontoriensis TaxID=2910246 RepID=UPI003D148BF1